jgi:hypothetical protein
MTEANASISGRIRQGKRPSRLNACMDVLGVIMNRSGGFSR